MKNVETPLPLGARPGAEWSVTKARVDMSRPARPVRAIELAAQPQAITIDAGKTAMIVIDMQNDFCTKGGWLDHIGVDFSGAREAIAPLNRLLPALRRADVPIVWVNWGNRPDRANLSPCALHVYNGDGRSVGIGDPLPASPVPGARVLEKGSWAAAIVDELEVAPADLHVDKYRMSGFWDTPLDSILRNLGVTTVLFGGVNADQCVLATLMDANFAGYDTILVEDCSATTSPAYCWDATLYNVRTCFGFTVHSDALVQALPR
jgi:ureidoacrylate peracid hydrolase